MPRSEPQAFLGGAACRLLAHPIVPLNWGNAIRPPPPAAIRPRHDRSLLRVRPPGLVAVARRCEARHPVPCPIPCGTARPAASAPISRRSGRDPTDRVGTHPGRQRDTRRMPGKARRSRVARHSPTRHLGPVCFGDVQLLPDSLVLTAARSRQPQQRHLVGPKDLVLDRVPL